MNELTDALTRIVEVLTPLESADRHRTVGAAMTLLGETVPTAADTKGAAPDPEGSNKEGFSATAAAWMKKHGVTPEALDHVYHFGGDGTFVVQDAPGTSKREQTLNTYTLTGLARFLLANDRTFDDATARGFCATIGCLDGPNHAKTLKEKHPQFTGDKTKGYSLTNIGLAEGAALVKAKAGGSK